jgi:hypothetical protein
MKLEGLQCQITHIRLLSAHFKEKIEEEEQQQEHGNVPPKVEV